VSRLAQRALFLLATAGCGGNVPLFGLAPASVAASSNTVTLEIPPRYQWNHNYGYCGEVSLISAGLFYGEYLSQYDARAAADSAPQNEGRSQLLLGVNAMRAASRMHLAAVKWDVRARNESDGFLAWVRARVTLGEPVAIGIYMNQFRFYHKHNPRAGSPEYDHIVPVTGVTPEKITFSDNGEWGSLERARYFFTYRLRDFARTRGEANAPGGPIYSLASKARDFGIAITGVMDRDHETVPVRVTTNLDYELPQIAQGSSRRPAPERLVLTVTVFGMKPGASYNVYRYDKLSAIPNGAFNAHASRARRKWNITAGASGQFVITEGITSDEVAAYRAVPENSP